MNEQRLKQEIAWHLDIARRELRAARAREIGRARFAAHLRAAVENVNAATCFLEDLENEEGAQRAERNATALAALRAPTETKSDEDHNSNFPENEQFARRFKAAE